MQKKNQIRKIRILEHFEFTYVNAKCQSLSNTVVTPEKNRASKYYSARLTPWIVRHSHLHQSVQFKAG